MITDIIELNNFIILIETSDSKEAKIEKCKLDDDVIGISFYASGNVLIEVFIGNEIISLPNKKGICTSFFGNRNVRFVHNISGDEPLRSVSVFSTLKNIKERPQQENELYLKYLHNLIYPTTDFLVGKTVKMSPEMQIAVLKIFNTNYKGSTRLVFLKSQITELLSHYFASISQKKESTVNEIDTKKINLAKDIIIQNMDKPPSISELSKLIGLNSSKLKKNFKQVFGVPIFKYIQNERLQKAHQLLSKKNMAVQEVAWYVGYESLSSFSNAFVKKYGFRPSEVGK